MRMNTYHQTDLQQLQELEVIQLAKMDPAKFEPLYTKYYPQIFRYIYQRIADKDLAFDITSQVFLKALNSLNKYEYRGVPFSSWLYRIAKSELYQSFRDEKSNRTVDVDPINMAHLMDDLEDENNAEERLSKVLINLKHLKESELALIELRFFEKRSFKEIADLMYITENNAKVKCFRVLEKLKKMM